MHDGPRGVIGFDPVWKPDDHRSFFTSAAGFGVFSQKRAGNTQTCALDLRDGHLNLRRIVLHLPDGTKLSRASVKVAGRPVAVDAADKGRRVELSLNEPIVVAKNRQVEIQLKW